MRLAIALLLVAGCTSQLPGPVSRPDVHDLELAAYAAQRWTELELPPLGDCPLPRIIWPASDETAASICRGSVSECYASVRPGPVSTERVPVIVIHHDYPRWFWVHGLLHRFQHCAGIAQDHSDPLLWGAQPWGGLLRELHERAR